jgi:hypothetical protein
VTRRRFNANGDENELVFQGRVVGLFRVYGFERIYHAPAGGHRGRVSGEQLPEGRGFPDLVAINGPRLVVAELKASAKLAESERLRPGQLEWLEAFARLGRFVHDAAEGADPEPTIEAHLWTPEDWDELHDVIRAGMPRRRDLDPQGDWLAEVRA